MILVATSKEDKASMNILKHLLEGGEWSVLGEFEGNPIYSQEDMRIVTIEDNHLFHDNLDSEVSTLIGEEISNIIYTSKHRSESGLRSLTVHPIGNFSLAEYGGKQEELVPSSPYLMTSALRSLKEQAKGMEYSVSFEATHHGPFLTSPTFFIEIGSDETAWKEERAGKLIAHVILNLKGEKRPIAIGVGGGHYAPRITDVAFQRNIAFGHIIPSYALENIKEKMLLKAIECTRGSEFVYFHRKAMKKFQVSQLEEWFEDRGLKVIREKDLE